MIRCIAWMALLFLIRIPESKCDTKDNVLTLAKEGLMYLKANPMIMTMLLFFSGVNLIASVFDGILPGLVLPNPKGGSSVLGMVTACAGIAMAIPVSATLQCSFWADSWISSGGTLCRS